MSDVTTTGGSEFKIPLSSRPCQILWQI